MGVTGVVHTVGQADNGRYRRAAWGFGSALICVLLATMASATALGAPRPPEPEIVVEFDRQAFVANEPFQVQISITAEGEGEPQISLPGFDGFQVLRKNVTRPASGYSFSFSFGTGQNSRQVIKNSGTTTYDIVLMAPKPGKFSVGPVKVVLDGYTFTGRRYPIEVFDKGNVNGAAIPDTTTGGKAESDDLTEEQLDGARIDPDYFLHMIPSKRSCRVGEQIVLDVYLFTAVSNIRADQFEKEPGTEGFWVERFEDFDLRNHRNRQVVINGVLYEQALLKKLALFPIKSGELTIAPPVFSFVVGGGGFFSFSRGKQVKRAASPVVISVSPLPTLGRPQGFSDANVGQYNFLVDASDLKVKVGEPVTVTVSVRGSGNIRGVELPVFGDVNGFKTYAPETEVEVQARGGGVSGVSQSRTLFIPEKDGRLVIPSLTFHYFDLIANGYKTRTSEPIEISVAPGRKPTGGGGPIAASSDSNASVSLDGPMERMNAQMRTIINDVDNARAATPLFARGWYLALIFGVPTLFGLYLTVVAIRRRSAQNAVRGRSKRAESEARRALTALEREKALSNDQFFSRLHKILLGFLDSRLEETVTGDTMNQLRCRLVARGIEPGVIKDVIGTLEEYEFARFAKSDGTGAERTADLRRAEQLVSKLGTIALTPLPSKKGGKQ